MPRKRTVKARELRPRLHIFCEGEKTEPNYLQGYIEAHFPGTRLTLIRKTKKNTPVQLVEEAIAEKKNKKLNPEGDQFWVVYDREAVNKYPHSLHAEAYNNAKAASIKIALSNVCFEVWILLHFQKTVTAYDSYSNLRKHSKLTTHIPGYDKGAKYSFSASMIDTARRNAKALNRRTQEGANRSWTSPHQWNPYTNVYELLDAIDEFGSRYIDG